MQKRVLWSVIGVGALLALACSGGDGGGTDIPEPPEPPPIPDGPETPEPTPEPAAGALPFDFDNPAIAAAAGQFVLAPSRQPLDEALGGSTGSFIYYGATMVSAGAIESTVRSLAGTEYTLPNALIIPIKPKQTAKKGDILLGHWESGSGLQRAIVVGGTATEPVVRYLDIGYDNPSGWGQKDDTFQPDRFQVLSEAGQIGATVACQGSGGYEHGVLTAAYGDQVLVSGFAGSLKAYPRGECVDITPKPALKAGQTVQVPVIGKYTEGTVKSVDMATGRVTVTYTWGGGDEEKKFAIVDVTPSFEAPAPSAGNTDSTGSNNTNSTNTDSTGGDDSTEEDPSEPGKGKRGKFGRSKFSKAKNR